MALKPEDVGPQHLELTKTLIRLYPGVAEIATIAERAQAVGYPIPSFQDFVDSIGGIDTELEVNGRNQPIGNLRGLFPPYYFPIANENDLVAKLHHAYRISNRARCQ